MINNIKIFIKNEKSLYFDNKIKYIFSSFILIGIALLSFLLPGLSYTSLHKIPLLFAGFLSLMIFIYLFLYQKIFIDKYIISMLLFCLVIITSSLLNDPKQIRQTEFLLVGIFIMLYEFMSSNENKNKSIFSLYVGLSIFALCFFLAYFKEIISLDVGRLGRIFGNENAIGNYFCLGYIIGLYLALIKKKYILIITVPFFALLGALTGSKTFLVSLVMVTIAFIFLTFGKKKWYFSIAIMILGVACIIGFLQLSIFETLKHRLLTMIKTLTGNGNSIDMSTIERYNMFFEGVYLFTYKPIFGWGCNGFALNGAYHTYSHSTISEVLCNFGMVGFICFFMPLVLLAFNCQKASDEKKLKIMLLVFIICINLFGVSFSSKIYYLALSVLCACSDNYIETNDTKWLFYKK